MIYTHVARQGVANVPSPLDLLNDVSDDKIQERWRRRKICENRLIALASANPADSVQ